MNVGNTGTTDSPTTNFDSLDKAFVLFKSNRFSSAGPSTPSGTNRLVDDVSMAVRLTATDTIAIDRLSGGDNQNYRCEWESWEYTGGAGGANEFKVIGRASVTLTAGTRNTTVSWTGSNASNADDCIPFITGITNTQATTDSNGLTAYAKLTSTSQVFVERGGSLGTTVVEITIVEFTGSNWTVGHSFVSQTTSDSGTATLYSNKDGVTTTLTLTSIDNAFLASVGSRGDTNDADEALADNWPNAYLSSTTQISWAFDANHAVTNGNAHFFHVLYNADIDVTRYTDTQSLGGDMNVNITTAGLTDLSKSAIFGTRITSGTGTAFPRGTMTYKLDTTTQAVLWCTRSGNTISSRIEIIDLSGLS